MRHSIVGNLATPSLHSFVDNLLWPGLILAALIVLGHRTGLIAWAG